jgi:hypothetical protein
MEQNDLIGSARSGLKLEADCHARYEVHREREGSQLGVPRPPLTEEFYGLDRARIAALGYALDGRSQEGSLTGTVRIVCKIYRWFGKDKCERRMIYEDLIDVIDERVAARLLNEIRIPRADELAVSMEQLQRDVDALRPYQ